MLPGIVHRAARRFGDAPAIVAPQGWSVSYHDLETTSGEVAAGLAERGVGPGDLVALVLPSCPEYVLAYLGAARLGAVTTGVNPRFTAHEKCEVLAVARPQLVVTTDDLARELAEELGETPVATVRLSADGRELASSLRAPAEPPPAPQPDPERLVAVVFTSGTTGTPRGAMFGERELDAIGRIDLPGWDEPDPDLASAPSRSIGAASGQARADQGSPMLVATQLAHVGFMTKLPWYLRAGCQMHLLERWRPSDVLRVVSEQKMTSVGGVAPQLALLLAEPDFDSYDLSNVQTIVMGGALSPPALVREARSRFGAKYSIRYSSTESGGVGTATAFDADDDEALHTVGRPRRGVEVDVRPPGRDTILPAGEVGEICLRSPAMMRGYWRDPQATASALRGGWLRTGDLGWIDGSGLLHLAGRAREMFVRGGYNVFPLEVEAVLASHREVKAVAVVPRTDAVMGEVGVAVVVPRRPGWPPDLVELRRFAGQKLAKYKLPEAMVVLDELPLTSMQKVDRKALRELVER